MAKRGKKKKEVGDVTHTSQEFVTKSQFDEAFAGILTAIKGISAPSVTSTPPEQRKVFAVTGSSMPPEVPLKMEDANANVSNYTLNPAHQAIFEEFFDPADGFEGRLQYPYFTIIVPLKFSNADAAWKKYYKVDTRQKFLKYDNIEGGMRDWCKLVSGNIKYNRNVKIK